MLSTETVLKIKQFFRNKWIKYKKVLEKAEGAEVTQMILLTHLRAETNSATKLPEDNTKRKQQVMLLHIHRVVSRRTQHGIWYSIA